MQDIHTDVVVSLAEYKHELAIKLWRESKLDEARPLAKEAVEGAETPERRMAYTNTLSIIEQSAGNLSVAIQLINAALPEAMALKDEFRLAKLYMTQGINYDTLADAIKLNGERRKREDSKRGGENDAHAIYEARQNALIHFAGAIGFYKKLHEVRRVMIVENSVAKVLVELNQAKDALEHLSTAVEINRSLKDRTEEDDIKLLQIYDTRARAKEALASNCVEARDALRDALASCKGLDEAEEHHFLKTSRKTLVLCLARLDYLEESELLQGALNRVNGQPKKAADLLKMNHGTFIRLCEKHPELNRQPKKKPRGRSCKSGAHG